MADPYVLGAGAIVAYLSKDGLAKLLGPTSEYLGDGLKDLTQRRVENVAEIFRVANEKLGDHIRQDGKVPPKVLKEILNEGSYSEDHLAIEYFGGVLASSRTHLGRDDRGARVSKSIGQLSSYQLRTHYIIYNAVASLFRHTGLSLTYKGRGKMQVFFPIERYLLAMGFSAEEVKQFDSIMRHTFFGLSSDNMIEGRFQYGSNVEYYSEGKKTAGSGVVCQPSALGADVFLWAHGKGNNPTDFLFTDDFKELIDNKIVALSGPLPASREFIGSSP